MDDDDINGDLDAAIKTVMAKRGNVTIKWVAAVEVLEPSGERSLWTLAPDGQMSWDSLGLLRFAEHQELSDD